MQNFRMLQNFMTLVANYSTEEKIMAYFKVRDTHWEVITSFMENHPGFATGRLNCVTGRDTYNSLWEALTNELNALGLVHKWQKTWVDVKCNLKKSKCITTRANENRYSRKMWISNTKAINGRKTAAGLLCFWFTTAITSPGVSGNNRSLRLTPTPSSNYSEVLQLFTAASRNPLDNTRLIELPNQSSTIVFALSRLTPTKRNRSPTVSNLQECSIKNEYEQSKDEETHVAQNGVRRLKPQTKLFKRKARQMITEHFDMYNSNLDVLKTISKTLIDMVEQLKVISNNLEKKQTECNCKHSDNT
ncbi:hypothetical protein FQA39_LY09448 [Lamprigera yunnana]|nr:hypothetical protein FQA39_LY09448 [Lamprigera yunnana]